jgi:RNA polymerase sigma factor (sigma-70 family)
MIPGRTHELLQHLHRLAVESSTAEVTDAELVEGFARRHDEVAFAALVRRHGPMVLGVCRRLLASSHDAEDAFQATFLVLTRKAGRLRRRSAVGSWLYGVAYRVALRCRASRARRRAHEGQLAQKPAPDLLGELSAREAQTVLDQELHRMPDKLRAPLELCGLEGMARPEAARQLGWSLSLLKSRLEAARRHLRGRLTRRGLALPAALSAALLAEAAAGSIPDALVETTVRAARAFVVGRLPTVPTPGSPAAALAEDALQAMATARLKTGAALVLALLLAAGISLFVAAHLPGATVEAAAVLPAMVLDQGPGPQVHAVREEPPGLVAVHARDWPQWRGPNRDGVVHGVTVPKQWPRTLTEEWQVHVGEGYASPVLVGDRIYVFTRQKDDEVMLCLALATGKELWRSESYPAPWQPGPGAPGDKKPRATPTVAGGRVFTLGASGILSCFDATTGKLHWRKDTRPTAQYGLSASPLVDGGLCIAQVGKGGLTAFDVATGEVKWCHEDPVGGPGYGSPILAKLAGKRQVVTVTQSHFLGVTAAAGKLLWQVHVPRFDLQQCITPVLYKDLLIVADSGEPLRALRLEKGARGLTATEVWKAKGHTMHMSSPVLAGDWVVGFSGQKAGHLFCLDARTGRTLWQSEGRLGGEPSGYASILNAGSVWQVLTNSGRLVVVRASGTAYEPLAQYDVAETSADAHPVFLGDRILIKDATRLRLFRFGPGRAPNGDRQTAVDLQAHANHKLKESSGGAGYEANTLAALPAGEQVLGGVKWRIGADLILLSGKSTPDRPRKVEGIKVNSTCAKLHFLHATHFAAEDGATVGYYLVNYEDKSQQKIPIVYGKNIGDWWYNSTSKAPTGAEVAWKGGNDSARKLGYKLRLYASTWTNPAPAVHIASIDFVSTNDAKAAPFCLAITAEK